MTAFRTLLLACTIGSMLFTHPGSGSENNAGGASKRVVVMVSPRNSLDMSRRAAGAIRSHLSDLPVSLHLEWVEDLEPMLSDQVRVARRVAEKQKAVAVVWADFRLQDRMFLFIAEPGGVRILVRSVASEGGGREARLEAMAVIVRTAVKAMMVGGTIGVRAPVEMEPSAGFKAGLLDASVAYGLFFHSSQQPVVHGARVGLCLRLSSMLRAFAAYRLRQAVRMDTKQVSMDLRSSPVEIGLLVRWRLGRWKLDAGGGLILDYLTWSVAPRQEQFAAVSPSSRWTVGIVPHVSINWSVTDNSSIFISVAADLLLNERRYVIKSGDVVWPLVEPWNARPWIQVGAAFTLF